MASSSSNSRSGAAVTDAIWSLPSIIEYFKQDPEISVEVSDDDFGAIINPDIKWLQMVKHALEYQGFDPRVILSQLLRNRKSYESGRPEEIKWDLSNVGDGMRVTSVSKSENMFSNREPLHRDVNFLITVFLARNNHIEKITKKARAGIKDILLMLKEKYGIDDEVRKSGLTLESRTITLPRIAGVFPSTAVRMFHDRVVKEIVSYEMFPEGVKPETHAICCPLLPSLIPKCFIAADGNNFHPVTIWVAIKLDDTIHRKEEVPTKLVDLISYYRAAFNSSATPDSARLVVFKKIGLAEESRESKIPRPFILTTEAKALATACLAELKKMRLDDPDHNRMIAAASTGKLDSM